MSTPDSFLSWQAFGTLAGSAGAVVFVAAALHRATGFHPRFLPFALSIVFVFSIQASSSQLVRWPDWVLTFVNGCLCYLTAVGGNEMAVELARPTMPEARMQSGESKRWFESFVR